MRLNSLFDYEGTPRQTFARFPSWSQAFITFLSGVPAVGERPILEIEPWLAIAFDVSKLVAGVALGVWALHKGHSWPLLLLPAWILVVNGARSLTSDAHYAGHACVTRRAKIDWWIGEVLSTLVLSASMKDYAPGHNQRHHGRDGIVTTSDPDLQLMFTLGFETGRPTYWYFGRLYLSLISPRFHFVYLKARLISNFISADWIRRALAWGVHGGAAFFAIRHHLLELYCLAWLVPILPLYAISAALQFPSEHLWLLEYKGEGRRSVFLRRLSHGRFFLARAPRTGLAIGASIIAWGIWLIRMLPMMFERFFVCVSILPAHDYHHRHALTRRWPMEPYLRAREIEGGAIDFREYYGLMAAYIDQFRIWSELPQGISSRGTTTLNLIEGVFLKYFRPDWTR
jgi:hypothetical protein